MEHAGVAQHLLDTHAIQMFDPGTDIVEANPTARFMTIPIDGAVWQAIAEVAQPLLAVAQSVIGHFAIGNVEKGADGPAHRSSIVEKGQGIPKEMLAVAVHKVELEFRPLDHALCGDGALQGKLVRC